AVLLAVAALLTGLRKKDKFHLGLIFCFLVAGIFAGEHLVFNTKFLNVGPATGGNLRYFNVIAPLVSLLGAFGFERFCFLNRRDWRWLGIVVVSLALIYFTAYEHNNIKLNYSKRALLQVIPMLAIVGSLWIKLRNDNRIYVLFVCVCLQVILMVKPIKISSEDALAFEVAKFVKGHVQNDQVKVASAHSSINYELYGKVRMSPMKMDSIRNHTSGDLVIWDSHYSPRNGVTYEALLADSINFAPIKQDISPDKRFGTIIFQKR
ncbi:MAG: hypothetical protein AAFR14_12225, partial [Bacteroidota bacterium]